MVWDTIAEMMMNDERQIRITNNETYGENNE